MDRAKLAKLLALTASDHDHEALSAMRMANAMVKAAGVTWDELLAPPQNVIAVTIQRNPPWQDMTPRPSPQQDGDWTAPHLSDKPTIELMFKTIEAQQRLPGSEHFFGWVANVKARFERHGNVTQREYDALRRSYSRAVKMRR